jgi:hypothetical protein
MRDNVGVVGVEFKKCEVTKYFFLFQKKGDVFNLRFSGFEKRFVSFRFVSFRFVSFR